MRIVRGIYKSRRFSPPKSFPSRPTTDFAKEGLFNMLENQLDLFDLNILDLCAGTGNISLEFLSREAGHVTSVDKHPVCVKFMYKLSNELNTGDHWKILQRDVVQFVAKTDEKYDLIFADPPYEAPFYEEMTRIILDRGLLSTDGTAIIEHGKQTDLSHLPGYVQTRNFGNVYFSFFRNSDQK